MKWVGIVAPVLVGILSLVAYQHFVDGEYGQQRALQACGVPSLASAVSAGKSNCVLSHLNNVSVLIFWASAALLLVLQLGSMLLRRKKKIETDGTGTKNGDSR